MSLKIITFANHKGGVSKTTSMGKKVLLIDLETVRQILPCISSRMKMRCRQASLTLWLMVHPCQ